MLISPVAISKEIPALVLLIWLSVTSVITAGELFKISLVKTFTIDEFATFSTTWAASLSALIVFEIIDNTAAFDVTSESQT